MFHLTVSFADPLRMLVFSAMNTDKANNKLRVDQKERGAVAVLQLKNAASGILDYSKGKTGAVAAGLNGVSNGIHTARAANKAFDYLCKGVNIVSKWVNPLLIVASGVRAYKAEDKKSAGIREAGAMTFMLGGEWIYKKLFGLGGHKACYQNIKPLNSAVKGMRNFAATNKYLSKLPPGKLSCLVKALGFIITSCGMFEIGSRTGKAIADRTTAKMYANEHPVKVALAKEYNRRLDINS